MALCCTAWHCSESSGSEWHCVAQPGTALSLVALSDAVLHSLALPGPNAWHNSDFVVTSKVSAAAEENTLFSKSLNMFFRAFSISENLLRDFCFPKLKI